LGDLVRDIARKCLNKDKNHPMSDAPLILWFRRDLRISDHPMLSEAVATGRPIIPVFILDPETEGLGAAPKWRLGLGIEAFGAALRRLGASLVLRRGPALQVLQGLIAETGAQDVWWSRLYDPAAVARDTAVKAALKADGIGARSFAGHLLHEPWQIKTGAGGFYRVFTPFWRAVRDLALPDAAPPPTQLRGPQVWPKSDQLGDWRLHAGMDRGADVVAKHVCVGQEAAWRRMADFLAGPVAEYPQARDLPSVAGTSALSENLTYGEISPLTVWHAGMRAALEGRPGAEAFLRQLIWREFSYHLIHHTPHIASANWRPEWDSFPWRGDSADAERWRRGMTGEPFVDAAMREMYVTGMMHNRGRMIVASYLTKHLLTDWRIGLKWFEDCLIDWDPAANAMGWQWVAGSGPDSAPYFRIFNPETQAKKFDPSEAYRHRFIAELSTNPSEEAASYFRAVPRSWAVDAKAAYPAPLIELSAGRTRALAAYGERNS
jgi:deoxyribodipyrimidine photo-lyase